MTEKNNCLECSYIGERKVKLCARCKSEAFHKYELCEHFAHSTEVENARRCSKCQAEIDEVFESFWREIVCDGEGNLDREKVKAELFDFHFIMGQVSEVYGVITRGQLSKPNYYSKTVIYEYERQVEKQIEEALEDEREKFPPETPPAPHVVSATADSIDMKLDSIAEPDFNFCKNCRKVCGITGDLRCATCGCTESAACDGGCEWTRPGRCSVCAEDINKFIEKSQNL